MLKKSSLQDGSWAQLFAAFLVCCVLAGMTSATAAFAGQDSQQQDGQDDQGTDDQDADDQDVTDEQREIDPAAGHSYHGEAFNEGARQAAYLMGGTGNVHLEISTQNEDVQKFFDQGVGQLHGFWYLEAERSFRQAAALESECAMLYWGMAMANYNNADRAEGFMEKALALKDTASPREQMWIDSLNAYLTESNRRRKWGAFKDALEEIIEKYPDELEARAFWCFAAWSGMNRGRGGGDEAYEEVDTVIEEVLTENPLHPAHHYRIHLWDTKEPSNALESAALCGPASPVIAHMWHMPGHIYWRLKRYHDSAWQQEASARADHIAMMNDHVMPYQIHNYAHNNEWLTRSLSHIGRVQDAVALAQNMVELPRHPKDNSPGTRSSSAGYGRTRLLEILSRYELWEQLLDMSDGPYLDPTDITSEQIKRLKARGEAHFGLRDAEKLQLVIEELQSQAASFEARQEESIASAVERAKEFPAFVGRTDSSVSNEVKRKFRGGEKAYETAIDELEARLEFLEGDKEEAVKKLAKVRGIPKEHLSMLYLEAGDEELALKTAKDARKENEVYPLANYIYVAQACGEEEEAKEAFEELRGMSSEIDLDAPVFRRLTAFAADCGFSADWRMPREMPEDLGDRPDLETIGPFRWQPVDAADWQLPSTSGNTLSLADYEGKPVVVIFYLGFGCLHCAQQLELFGPETEKFREAGIEIVGISTDNVENLQNSFDAYRREMETKAASGEDIEEADLEFPFPLVADPDYDVFRQYRVFDDFESLPLHGTFLIDGSGKIRWQDISYEPFMDPDFLLEEAQRLLKQTETVPTSTTQD